MKRSIAFLVFTAFLVCIATAGLAAQNTTPEKLPGSSKDLYVKTIYIMKVYPHALGYKVDYLTYNGYVATTYLPLKWFAGVANKGEMVSDWDPSAPFMEIVYDAGKFKLVRLHVTPSYADRGWGSLPSSMNIDDKFAVEAPVLTF